MLITPCRKKTRLPTCLFIATLLCAATLVSPDGASAYIGPGAGFAIAGPGLAVLAFLGVLAVTVLLGPFIWVCQWLKRLPVSGKARASRVVIAGLDGLEPKLAEKFMSEGLMPQLRELSETGGYKRLGTTIPAISPVAWSSFQTGVNPGAHNIFDFITRDKRTCLPKLSSTSSEFTFAAGIAGWLFRRRAEKVKLLRGGKAFWNHLGRHGITSNIIRVPVSYPPEPLSGNILSGMCAPDLRGSQGTFMYFSRGAESSSSFTDGTTGEFHKFLLNENTLRGWVEGPSFEQERAKTGFTLEPSGNGKATLKIGKETVSLTTGILSDWIPLAFITKGGAIHGIARFCLRKPFPDCELYVSPVNVDPARPALPISFPRLFSVWLAKTQGAFGTLGLLEDTWGRNEGALDDAIFLEQTRDSHREREKMFFSSLSRTTKGLCVGVFDAPDRVQHMFWRYLEEDHPAPKEDKRFKTTIRDLYVEMDEMVGRIRKELGPDDVLFVISDHGFASFRRCVNLNTWLWQNGYLVLKEGAKDTGEYFSSVDWSRTSAFAIGLAGIFINRKGREQSGTVEDGRFPRLKNEIIEKLSMLKDPVSGSRAIRRVYDSEAIYTGLYKNEAPDLIPGFENGYRVSWESALGRLSAEVFYDNKKAWSGDHHVDPELVPGVIFSNRKFINRDVDASLLDLAPTVLSLFGVSVPEYMEGKVIV